MDTMRSAVEQMLNFSTEHKGSRIRESATSGIAPNPNCSLGLLGSHQACLNPIIHQQQPPSTQCNTDWVAGDVTGSPRRDAVQLYISPSALPHMPPI